MVNYGDKNYEEGTSFLFEPRRVMSISPNDWRGVADTAIQLTRLAFTQLRARDLAGFLRLGNEAEKALVYLELQTDLPCDVRNRLVHMRRELAEMRDEVLTITVKAIPPAGDA